MLGISSYITGGLVAAALAGGAYGYFQAERNKTLVVQAAAFRGQLSACGNRLNNLIEDVRSDNEIDNLPDSALTVVPEHWLRPTGDSSGD